MKEKACNAARAAVLSLAGLSLRRAGRVLLDDVSFTQHAGEFIALIGPNGAGKSTLIRAVSGEWNADGDVHLFGRTRRAWPQRQLAQHVAVMPQHSTLAFDFSVREVVQMGRLPHRQARADENAAHVAAILQELDLEEFADRPFTTLSGGERQRVQFARVLAQIAGNEADSLLILDEPTAALDLAQQAVVLGLARRRAAQGAAVLAVVHDLNLAARYADRVLLMKAGRLHADGTAPSIYRTATLSAAFGIAVDVERAQSDGRPLVVVRGQTPAAG
ncbi:MAG: heme ABC transporter ATP-binding protein [Burkholderiales bacterium]|nr:heme ABC transporter ATP-binding protein [Burkholderiales bacterium]